MSVNLSFVLHKGNENIHTMTSSGDYGLYIELERFIWETSFLSFARYSSFKIDDTNSDYELHVDGYSGTAGMALKLYFVYNLLYYSIM